MRYLHSVLCLGIAGILSVQSGVFADGPSNADEVIARYVKAIGGKEKMESVKTMRVTGKAVFGGGMEAPTVRETMRPNKFRLEFTFQGMTGTQAYDGKSGWSIMPFQGKTDPEKMSEDDVKEVQDDADVDGPLVDYKAKGHQVELVGKEDVEGASAYKLKVSKKGGDTDYHFIDAETYLPIKVTSKRKVQGTEMEFEQLMSDYKSVDGFVMAHSIQNRAAGGAMGGGMTFVFEKVELNPSIKEDRFLMPEVKKAEAPAEKKDEAPAVKKEEAPAKP